jgi:superfamily I DNA/RNA helicase
VDRPLVTDQSIVRVHVGRVELDSSWEGGFAFRPLDFDDIAGPGSFEASRYAWSGTVYEIDADAGDIFIGLKDGSGAPTPGDFIVKPFEFTRFLHEVYQQAGRGPAGLIGAALGLSAGTVPAVSVPASRLGVPALEPLWGHRWTVLWGPPGTGKTHSLGELVAAASARSGERILVVSTTNKATDGAALSIVGAMRRRSQKADLTRVLRIGAGADLTRYRAADATELLDGGETAIRAELNAKRRELDRVTRPEERAAIKREIEALRKQLREADLALFDPGHQVVIATAFKAVQILADAEQSPVMGGPPPFSTVIIDEAGLVSRAATAALALHAGTRVILVGDPRQLAPISRVARVEVPRRMRWLGESSLAHLTPTTLTSSTVMLTAQWRMAPQIRELVSNYQYDGRLEDAPPIPAVAAGADLDPLLKSQPRALWYVLDEEASSPAAFRAQRPERGGSWHRPMTIDVLRQVFDAHPKLARGPGLFVSPFVAQGREIRQWLANHPVARDHWRASTIHAQQGAEADYVIFDTVHASSTAWPTHEWMRLVNVGLSRAKQVVLLIASRDEMQQPFLASLVDHIAPRVLRGRGPRTRWEAVPAKVAHEPSAKVRASDPTTLGAQLDDRGSMLRLLSAEQERLCNMRMDGGPRLVRGVAGSGKTVVMASWVARTLEEKPRGALWIVYGNAALKGLLDGMVSDALRVRGLDPATKQVSYFHIKELLGLLMQAAGVYYRGDPFDYNTQAARYLTNVGRPKPLCDAVFVDEGQDMGPETLRLLHQLVKPVDSASNRRQAVIFFDNAQNIYGRGTPQWSDLGIDMRGRSTVMKESFRSTRPITEFALNLLYRLLPPREDPDHRELLERGLVVEGHAGKRPWWRVRFCHVDGPRPQVELFGSRDAELETLGQQIEKWIRNEGVRPRDIRIIANRLSHCGKIEATLTPVVKRAGAKIIAQASEQLTSSDDTIVVSTPHSFKGHDAEIVAVACADGFVHKAGGILATNLYVAMTRARSVLWVSGKGSDANTEGARLTRIIQDIDRCLLVAESDRPPDGDGAPLESIPSPKSTTSVPTPSALPARAPTVKAAAPAKSHAKKGRAPTPKRSVGPGCPICNAPMGTAQLARHIVASHPLDRSSSAGGFGRCPVCRFEVRADLYEKHLARHIRKLTSRP